MPTLGPSGNPPILAPSHIHPATLATSDSQIPRLLDGLISAVSHNSIRQNKMSTPIEK